MPKHVWSRRSTSLSSRRLTDRLSLLAPASSRDLSSKPAAVFDAPVSVCPHPSGSCQSWGILGSVFGLWDGFLISVRASPRESLQTALTARLRDYKKVSVSVRDSFIHKASKIQSFSGAADLIHITATVHTTSAR